MEEVALHLDEARELMEKSVQHTAVEFARIRAGKATPNMLDNITVEYYGTKTPIGQMASVTTPDARTIAIKPFERKQLSNIERAIRDSDLGVNPQNDGEIVRISIPPLTEERRLQLVKQARAETENGKVSIRNIRKETNNALKDLQKEGVAEDEIKRAEDKVQALTDQHIAKVEELMAKKEKEIMTI